MLANMLLRDGHDVQVLEMAAGSLDGRGAGIVSHRCLERGLRRAGLPADASLGVAVPARVLLDQQGNTAYKRDLPQVLTSWSRLYHLLREIFPAERYVQPVTVSMVQASEIGVSVGSGPNTWRADLLIASDGIRSAVRQQFAPDIEPQYAGYVAWRGICDEAILSRYALSSMFGYFSFGLPPGEQMIGYPVAGAGHALTQGRRSYNFVWYRPADQQTLRDLLTDADGHFHPNGIAPQKVSWRCIAAMRQAARDLLAPQFAEVIEKTAMPFLQPIYDACSTQIVFGRVALMGDAAFVARPHVGAGVAKAAEDALALADAIREHGATPAALLEYQRKRLPVGQAIVERGRRLGTYLQSWSTGGQARRSLLAEQDVVNETAIEVSDFTIDDLLAVQCRP